MARRIQELLTAGATPVFSAGDDRLMLRAGRRYARLSDDAGALTGAGAHYQALTGSELPVSGFQRQAPQRVGNTETVRLRGGARGVTCRYDPVSRAWSFTNLGSRFYRQIRRT